MPQLTAPLAPAAAGPATEPPPSAWKTFWRILTRFDRADISASMAARNALCIAIPLAIGALLDYPGAGLVAASGAMNASFSDGHDPYRRRIQKMTAASVMCGIAVFLGAVTGHNHVLAVLVSSMWAFGVGMLGALGTAASDVGNISLFTLCVYASQSMSVEQAALSGLLALSGGLLQTGCTLILWPTLPYQPERRALGNLYAALSDIAGSIARVSGAPPATAQINQAQQALNSLIHDRTEQAERFLALLSHAERIRLSLLVLVRLRRRMAREAADSPGVAALDQFANTFAHDLELISHGIHTANYAQRPDVTEMTRLLTDFEAQRSRPGATEESSFIAALMRDAQRQMDMLVKQLDGVLDLIQKATTVTLRDLVEQELMQPWHLRLRGRAATLLANLNTSSAVFRHALRLSVCIAIGDATARALHIGRSYWCPMTIAIVLKPDFGSTFSRGVLRIGGTVLGLTIATLLFHASPNGVAMHIVFIAALSFVMRWLGPGNYGIVALTVSAVVVMMIAGTGVAPGQVIAARAANTLLGGVLALVSYVVWPTWERKRIRPIIADLLETYRAYFSAVMDLYRDASGGAETKVNAARYAARVARTNAIASLDRAAVEPATNREEFTTLNAAVSRSHDFVKCVMALEAALPENRGGCDSAAFRRFQAEVESYMDCLIGILRSESRKCGTALTGLSIPDTRLSADPYSLLNMESERMVRALDLLAQTIAP